jgi:deoxyxylulose-5-phosphate synthase
VGIAEQYASRSRPGSRARLASCGRVVAIYSTFLQSAPTTSRSTTCNPETAPVVFALDRAGSSVPTVPRTPAIHDIAYLRQ